jgi:ribonucleoside-diphosphate reductase alpha subunit
MTTDLNSNNIMKELTRTNNDNNVNMLPIFTINKFSSNKKLAEELFSDNIHITHSYIKKFIKFYYANVSSKHRAFAFPEETIIEDLLRELPTTKAMNRFELYDYIADYFATKSSSHLIYLDMASRILVHKLHKMTSYSIKDVVKELYENTDIHGDQSSLVSDEYFNIVMKHHRRIQNKIDINRDYLFDYFGMRTLERSYLQRIYKNNTERIIERPQHMIMRTAIGIHGYNLEAAFETYDLISQKYFTHATPTLFNAGTKRPQMSSCFLTGIGDSIESIFETISELAYISKWSGGIGIHLSSIRAKGSIIRGTNGRSDGIIPLCIVLNWVARYINQGGKRNGSIAVYMEPWHADIFEFIELRSNKGSDTNRARDLFLALWICDLFMKRVQSGGMWSLMCPDQCPGLTTTHSEEFEALYEKYEKEGKYVRQVPAIDLWLHIMTSHIETGFPYITFKDSSNKKSNQKNLGTIRSSNLCTEIIEFSDENEVAVCNLASVCLPNFIKDNENGVKTYDFELLMKITRVCVRNLNNVIDRNYYPTPKTKKSNMAHRPMGIGVQGLADVYNIMGYPFNSPEAHKLNKQIFECMYYAALDESKECARIHGRPYESFKGSPVSEGILQYHMWGLTENDLLMGLDWEKLKKDIKRYGIRNSLLMALMPTASTSQIMGNSECIEPYMSNIFVRSTLAGDFMVINRNLMEDLAKEGLWSEDMKKKLLIYNGSVQDIPEIPQRLRDIYKTAFEIKLQGLIQQSAERGPFICQSQSLNLFIDTPSFDIITTAIWEGYNLGLKTGMYYFRTVPPVNPIAFGVDVDDIKRLTNNDTSLINKILKSTKSDTDSEIIDMDMDMEEDEPSDIAKKAIAKLTAVYNNEMTTRYVPEECLMCGS